MKKVLLAVVCALMATTTFAQRASSSSTSFFSTEKSDQSVTVGIRGGLNFANQSFSINGISLSPSSRTSFNAGISVDIPLVESFYVQSGLYYTSKGCVIENGSDKLTTSLNYLEIPVLASYRYNFSSSTQLQFNVGPYFAYGLSGKVKEEQYGHTSESDVFGDDSSNRFDAGLQIGAGITVSKVYLGCAYEFGFLNINAANDNINVKNKNFMINLGYNF